jgi:Holliday junction DNA helicase RuvA
MIVAEAFKNGKKCYNADMIAHLKGTLLSSNLRYIVLDVNGVGYKVFTTNETLEVATRNPSEVSLWTYLAVRENALDLYGFATQEEIEFFELLNTISGIGPKSALSILSAAGLETLKSAIASGNASHLTKIAGIGRKNAEKIVLELHGKLSAVSEADGQNLQTGSDAIEALQSLGYSQKEARDAIKKVPKELTATNEIVKHALKILGTN